MNPIPFDQFAALYCATQESTRDRLCEILNNQKRSFSPDGWMILECQQFDSSRFGQRTILPYGPRNTLHELPTGPISPRGLASDISVVIAYTLSTELPAFEPEIQ
jgi:hypothetical protein